MPASADVIAAYIAHLADEGRAPRTIGRRLTAIRRAHALAGADDPTANEMVRLTWVGIRRTSEHQDTSKAPLMGQDIRAIVGALDENEPMDLRAKAVVLVGFAAALRRSEIAALKKGDLDISERGMAVTVRRSKSDKYGKGYTIGIHRSLAPALCPVAAAEAWMDLCPGGEEAAFIKAFDNGGEITSGPWGVCTKTINRIVKYACRKAGLSDARYGAHSLRSGHVSERRSRGEDPLSIAETSRHASLEMVRTYDKVARVWRFNVTERIGL